MWGILSCNTREGASKCTVLSTPHHTAGAIFVNITQIRIESMVMEVMSWGKKKVIIDCDVLVFLSACSYLMTHYK